MANYDHAGYGAWECGGAWCFRYLHEIHSVSYLIKTTKSVVLGMVFHVQNELCVRERARGVRVSGVAVKSAEVSRR
jgi:hypothetical protein